MLKYLQLFGGFVAVGIDPGMRDLTRDLVTIRSCITWMRSRPDSPTNHLAQRLSKNATEVIKRIGISTLAQNCKAADVELLQDVVLAFKKKQQEGVFKTFTVKRLFRKSSTEAHLEKLVGKIEDVLIELVGDSNGRILVLQGKRERLDEVLGELIRDNALESLNEESRQVLLDSILKNKGPLLPVHEQFLDHFFDKRDFKTIERIAERNPEFLRNWIEAHEEKSATRFSQLLQLEKEGIPNSALTFFVHDLLRENGFIPVLDKYIDQEMERNGHQPALLERNVVEKYLKLKYGFFNEGSKREKDNQLLGDGICYGMTLQLLAQGQNPNPLEEGFMKRARFIHAESNLESGLAKKSQHFKYRDSTGFVRRFHTNRISPSLLKKMKLEEKDTHQIDHRCFEKSLQNYRKEPFMLRLASQEGLHVMYVNFEQCCFCDQNDPEDSVTGLPVMRRFGSEKEMLRALSLYLEIEYPLKSLQAMYVSCFTKL